MPSIAELVGQIRGKRPKYPILRELSEQDARLKQAVIAISAILNDELRTMPGTGIDELSFTISSDRIDQYPMVKIDSLDVNQLMSTANEKALSSQLVEGIGRRSASLKGRVKIACRRNSPTGNWYLLVTLRVHPQP